MRKMNENILTAVNAMCDYTSLSIEDISNVVGKSKAQVYRYLNESSNERHNIYNAGYRAGKRAARKALSV